MAEVLNNVVHVLQTHRNAYCGVEYVHCSTLLVAERTEDGACRMNGECAVIEEVSGAMHQLQIIDEEYEDKKMPEFTISID